MLDNWLVKTATNYALNRLSEPSTWAGIAVSLAASLHLQFTSDFTKAFIGAGVALAALASVALKEGVRK